MDVACRDRQDANGKSNESKKHTWLLRQGRIGGDASQKRGERKQAGILKEKQVLFYGKFIVSGKMKPNSRENCLWVVIESYEGWGMRFGEIEMSKRRLERCVWVLPSWLKGAVNTGTPNTQLPRQEANWQLSKPPFPEIQLSIKPQVFLFSLWSLACPFPTCSNFEHPGLHIRIFFSRQQKNCLENCNRHRENLIAGDASAICISLLVQDFKLKTQNPTSLPLLLCSEKMANTLQGKKCKPWEMPYTV